METVTRWLARGEKRAVSDFAASMVTLQVEALPNDAQAPPQVTNLVPGSVTLAVRVTTVFSGYDSEQSSVGLTQPMPVAVTDPVLAFVPILETVNA